jgi:LPS O-antigen subunit length determinant protein (WzzB/FepE family)
MSQNRSNSNQNEPLQDESEISLMDILRFLKGAYKTILIFGVLGIAAAITYLVITPKQYEATAQIVMAQIGAANNNNNISPLGINIEEPALMIARLSNPMSFTPAELAVCGFEGKPDGAAALAKSIKLTPAKGVPNVVELKTFGPSSEAAKSCANAIFDFTKKTQAQIVAPYIEEAKIKLSDDEQRINRAKELVSRSDKGGSAMSAAYLLTRDEIRYLLDEMTGLKNILASNQNRATRLIAPIYASDAPIGPKKRIALAAGLFGGLFLGLLITLARQMMAKIKSQVGGVL